MGKLINAMDNKYVKLIIVALIIYFSMRFMVPLFLPFIIAFLFSSLFMPVINYLNQKIKVGKGILAGVILCTILLLLALIMWIFISTVFCNVVNFLSNISNINLQFLDFVDNCCNLIENKIGIKSFDVENFLKDKITVFTNNLQIQVMPKLMTGSVGYLKNIASAFCCLAITLISTILLVKDYDKIMETLKRQDGFVQIYEVLKKVLHLIAAFLKAQFIIFLAIGTICSIGFFLLKMNSPIGLGVITGFLDFLPFIGTGIILVPNAIFFVIQGEYLKAIGCIIIYLICMFVREFLEPKLIGNKIGIFPILVLASIFVGVKLFGIGGIVLGPISMLLLLEIYKKMKTIG